MPCSYLYIISVDIKENYNILATCVELLANDLRYSAADLKSFILSSLLTFTTSRSRLSFSLPMCKLPRHARLRLVPRCMCVCVCAHMIAMDLCMEISCICVKVCKKNTSSVGIGWFKIPYTVTSCGPDLGCIAANQKCTALIKAEHAQKNSKLSSFLTEFKRSPATRPLAEPNFKISTAGMKNAHDVPCARLVWS